MGVSKAVLPFGPELMLPRIVRLVGQVVDQIVVVAAPRQQLPDLPQDTIVAFDEREGRGPLEGLLAGIRATQPNTDLIYATSCDVPLFVPAFAQRLFDSIGDHDIAVPVDGKFKHPLSAVYRRRVLPVIEQLLRKDQLRPAFVFERVSALTVPVDDLREVDPRLDTLINLNDPRQYSDALRAAGFEPPTGEQPDDTLGP